MKNIRLLFCLFWVAFPSLVRAQSLEADSVANPVFFRNSLYVELGGNGLFGSLNYERVFSFASSDKRITFRVGGIFIPNGVYEGKKRYMMTVPVEVGFFWGKGKFKPEFGLGFTYYQDNEGDYFGNDIYRLVFPMI
jgi:hypothetical protein